MHFSLYEEVMQVPSQLLGIFRAGTGKTRRIKWLLDVFNKDLKV